MFPLTITLHDAVQLNAVMAALNPSFVPKSAVAAKAASGPATAKESAAPSKTVDAPARTAPSAASDAPVSIAADPNATASVNDAPATPTASEAAPTADTAPAETVSFDTLKKAFLALSTKEAGRAKCESVLKPLGLGKLSEATEPQYAGLLEAIQKASA